MDVSQSSGPAISVSASRAESYVVRKEDLPLMWQGVLQFMADKDGTGIFEFYAPGELYMQLLSDPNYDLWLAVEDGNIVGVAITSFVTTSKDRSLWVEALNVPGLAYQRQLMEPIEKYATFQGATHVKFYGPAAYKRILPDFDSKQILFQKNVRKAWGN